MKLVLVALSLTLSTVASADTFSTRNSDGLLNSWFFKCFYEAKSSPAAKPSIKQASTQGVLASSAKEAASLYAIAIGVKFSAVGIPTVDDDILYSITCSDKF